MDPCMRYRSSPSTLKKELDYSHIKDLCSLGKYKQFPLALN